MNATTPLRKALGRIPYLYTVEASLNDYQVVVNGPAGRAIITEINGGEDYEIETSFDGQSTRTYGGFPAPRAALDAIVTYTSHLLYNRGASPPPLTDPRHKYFAVAIVAVAVVLIAAALLFAFTGSGNDGRPTAPITYSPAQTLEGPR